MKGVRIEYPRCVRCGLTGPREEFAMQGSGTYLKSSVTDRYPAHLACSNAGWAVLARADLTPAELDSLRASVDQVAEPAFLAVWMLMGVGALD